MSKKLQGKGRETGCFIYKGAKFLDQGLSHPSGKPRYLMWPVKKQDTFWTEKMGEIFKN